MLMKMVQDHTASQKGTVPYEMAAFLAILVHILKPNRFCNGRKERQDIKW
jgi:hypothetical protein